METNLMRRTALPADGRRPQGVEHFNDWAPPPRGPCKLDGAAFPSRRRNPAATKGGDAQWEQISAAVPRAPSSEPCSR